MKKEILIALLITAWLRVAAQTAVVPAQEATTTGGPTLDVTMNFIQEQLSHPGKLNYITFWKNTEYGSKGSNSYTHEFSNVVADANKCRIAYHYKAAKDLESGESEQGISLHDVSSIVVKPVEQWLTEENATHHRSNILVTTTHPPVFIVVVQIPHVDANVFYFTDAAQAEKVGKALTHATALCGGGEKKELF